MKLTKRLLCLLLTLCLTAGLLSGCGKKQSAAQVELHPYKVTDVDTKFDELADTYLGDAMLTKDRLYTTLWDDDGQNILLSCKLDGSDVQKAPLKLHEFDPESGWGSINGFVAGKDGTLYALESINTYTEESGSSETYYLNKVDPAGGMVSSVELMIPEGSYVSAYNSISLNDGSLLFSADTQLLQVAPDGKIRPIELPENAWAQSMCRLPDGNVLLYLYADGSGEILRTLDMTTGQFGEETEIPAEMIVGASFMNDAQDNVYFSNGVGIYSYDPAANTCTILCNWLDSDIDYNAIGFLQAGDDGSFTAITRGDNYDKLIVSTLTYLDPDTLPEKTILTLACEYSWSMQQAVLKYNRASETSRIQLLDYSRFNTEENQWTGAAAQMNNDIISGKTPDILLVSSNLPVQNYMSKGILTDLYALMPESGEFSRENMFASVLKACEYDGRLMMLTPNFSVSCLYGNAETVGSSLSWTWDEFNAMLARYPECENAIAYMTRSDMLRVSTALNIGSFIDQATGECHFDSENFISLLEYAATFPEEIDWDNMEWLPEREQLAQHKALLLGGGVSDFTGIRDLVFNVNGPVAFKGMPTDDGSSGTSFTASLKLAISEACSDKQAAWDFLTYFLTEDASEISWGFPLRLDLAAAMADKALKGEENDHWIGGGVVPPGAVASETAEIEAAEDTDAESAADTDAETAEDAAAEAVPEENPDISYDQDEYWHRPVTQAEIDQVYELINSTSQLESWDEEMNGIIMEEAESFFNKSKSAAEVASIIQDRVQTYISETR